MVITRRRLERKVDVNDALKQRALNDVPRERSGNEVNLKLVIGMGEFDCCMVQREAETLCRTLLRAAVKSLSLETLVHRGVTKGQNP